MPAEKNSRPRGGRFLSSHEKDNAALAPEHSGSRVGGVSLLFRGSLFQSSVENASGAPLSLIRAAGRLRFWYNSQNSSLIQLPRDW